MQTIKIFIPLIIRKINDPIQIFQNIEIFEEILFWSRECTKERLLKHPTQKDLSRKCDDIGIEVDRYLIIRRLKMLNNGQKGKNSLFNRLSNTELTVKWLVNRWGNVFINIATNNRYKSFIDAGTIGCEMNDNIGHSEDALSILIEKEDEIMTKRMEYNVSK